VLLIPLVFVLVYYCYLSQLYATLCGYVNRPLGPLYIVIPCVNIIKDAKPIGFTVYHRELAFYMKVYQLPYFLYIT